MGRRMPEDGIDHPLEQDLTQPVAHQQQAVAVHLKRGRTIRFPAGALQVEQPVSGVRQKGAAIARGAPHPARRVAGGDRRVRDVLRRLRYGDERGVLEQPCFAHGVALIGRATARHQDVVAQQGKSFCNSA